MICPCPMPRNTLRGIQKVALGRNVDWQAGPRLSTSNPSLARHFVVLVASVAPRTGTTCSVILDSDWHAKCHVEYRNPASALG